jgi:tetratricopeptide (TPR) repeat protein
VKDLTEEITEEGNRAKCLGALAVALEKAGETQEAEGVFERASVVAAAIESEQRRADALSILASALARAGRFEQAHRVAAEIAEEWWCADAQSTIAEALTQAGRFDQARAIAEAMIDEGWRARLQRELAAALMQEERVQEGLALLQQAHQATCAIARDWAQADALCELGESLAQAGQQETAEEVFEQAREMR